MNVKLSIWSQYYYELKIEDTIERFIKNGIFACELSDEDGFELLRRSDNVVETGKKLKEFIEKYDFEISQGHLWLRAKICSEGAVENLYKWIDMYEAIGIKNMVLHCDDMLDICISKQERVERNIEKLMLIAEYVKDKDIVICLENLSKRSGEEMETVVKNADDLMYIIDKIGSSKFGICLDTGHLNLTDKDQYQFILKAGDKLKALHIADNEGFSDQHLMPFGGGNIDFGEVVSGLRKIGYNGVFNLEIPGETGIPIELRDAKLQYIKTCYEYLMK